MVVLELARLGGERPVALGGGENTTFKKMTIERAEGESELGEGDRANVGGEISTRGSEPRRVTSEKTLN